MYDTKRCPPNRSRPSWQLTEARCPLADGTFSELAGIDPTDHRAAAAGLPPIDSHSMVPVILGKGRSSRVEVPISTDIQLLPMWGK